MATAKQIAAARRNIKKAQKANRRKGGGGGRAAPRRKPIQRGIVGRIGAFMIGVVPPSIATIDASEAAYTQHKTQKASMISTIKVGFLRWVNNLGVGYFGIEPFPDYIDMTTVDGGTYRTKAGVGVPKGSFLTVTGVGLFQMGVDTLASKLAGGRPVKVIGTNYNATGGS